MAKITEYPKATKFDTGDVLIKDGTGGTKIITAENAASSFASMIVDDTLSTSGKAADAKSTSESIGKVSDIITDLTQYNHRNIFRGKYLGSEVTDAQKAAIRAGTFDDLYVGDYWTINNIKWRIADMDYFYRCGDSDFQKHHLVIVPDTCLYNAQMNETNTTEGGYVGSKMYTENLENAKTAFTNAFGDMILTHKEYLVNAVSSGRASAGAWFESTVELMNEIMVYGCLIYTPMSNGSSIPTLYTVNKEQLALFQLDPTKINIRATYWLRDVVSSTDFANMRNHGNAPYAYASNSYGVRPYALIG